jgi:hypothetical protein
MAKRKPRTRPPRVDPDEEWNKKHGADAGKSDWQGAVKICDEICEKVDEAPESIWNNEKGCEFFESVAEKAADMQETITKNQRVSDRQMESLQNMLRGVKKWLKED